MFSSACCYALSFSFSKISPTSFFLRTPYLYRYMGTPSMDGSKPKHSSPTPEPSPHIPKQPELEPNRVISREQTIVEFLRTFFRRYLYFKLVGGFAFVVIGGYLYLRETDDGITSEMVQVFEHGGVKGWNEAFSLEDKEADVKRENDKKDLLQILRPERSKKYGIVIGPHGVGKSTLTRQCIREIEEPKGVVYYLTPEILIPNFNNQLQKTIGYREPFDPMVRFRRWLHGEKEFVEKSPLPEPQASWSPLREKLLVVAQAFYNRHKKPAVLVIDGADLIVKKNSEFFGDLQNFAKLGADMGVLRVVFISSDGVALDFLKSKSAISRSLPVLEITEVDDQTAIEYMCQKGMPRDKATLAVEEITGGSFTTMQEYLNQWAMKIPHEKIWEKRMKKLEGILEKTQIKPDHQIFHELVAVDPISGVVDGKVAKELLGVEKCEKLVQENILSVHPRGGYRFNSRFIRSYFVRNIVKQE